MAMVEPRQFAKDVLFGDGTTKENDHEPPRRLSYSAGPAKPRYRSTGTKCSGYTATLIAKHFSYSIFN